MLFNSFIFIFAFLPATLLGYFVAGAYRREWAAVWLVAASLAFYAWWDPRYLPLLLVSAVTNFLFGRALSTRAGSRVLIFMGISFNLLLLAYFKYSNFIVANVQALSGFRLEMHQVILPLGISFFTFTQIAFLLDVFRGEVREAKPIHYLLFVTYFPHLIAGPILHHKEMMPQFSHPRTYQFDPEKLLTGCAIFVIGLFKKAVLADGVAPYANTAFKAAEDGAQFLMPDAWSAALAYTFQLYFDFSGYCDMAIGASLMFGIALPLNFNSPYKSRSIVEFWRRWHMTLSRFLRDYLYIPLGGSRKGGVRRYVNLFITMLLGGLWHGAGWTFVIWGALHGAYLCINHAFDIARAKTRIAIPEHILSVAGWALTFCAVVVGWVIFRAGSVSAALNVLAGMADLTLSGPVFHPRPEARFQAWIWCVALLGVTLLAPNTQEFMRDYLMGITRPDKGATLFGSPFLFRMTARWAMVVGVFLCAGLVCLPQPTSFLYFNF
ncbi:MAG TPA: MBOAT family protein [Rhizomicrobium sp.]|jgi:D-alanyl-lipoteichoic acid acyltransferase DltB (MBOAT superfamily)